MQVQTAKGVVTITWAEREQLLARLQPKAGVRRAQRGRKPPDPPETHREIVAAFAAFAAVGVSRPVSLNAEQRRELLTASSGFELDPDTVVNGEPTVSSGGFYVNGV
jgi:hypothetical protein